MAKAGNKGGGSLGGATSRGEDAYEGARLKLPTAARGPVSGSLAPSTDPNWTTGKSDDWYAAGGPVNPGQTVTGSTYDLQVGAAKGYVDPTHADELYAEDTGGPIAGYPYPREKVGLSYSANVPVQGGKPGQTAPLFLTSADPDEVEKLVQKKVISRATADKILGKREEQEKGRLVAGTKQSPAPFGSPFVYTPAEPGIGMIRSAVPQPSKAAPSMAVATKKTGAVWTPPKTAPAGSPLLPNVPTASAPAGVPSASYDQSPEYDSGPYDPGVEQPMGATLGKPAPKPPAYQPIASGTTAQPGASAASAEGSYADVLKWARAKWGL